MTQGSTERGPEPLVRQRVIVHGRVQGVFFRHECLQEAQRRGLVGWVRNRLDDTVEAVFEGPAWAVPPMIEWVRQGPPLAMVERVEVFDEEPEGLPDFRVRHYR